MSTTALYIRMASQHWKSNQLTRRICAVLLLVGFVWLIFSPAMSAAFVGLGGYVSEKTLGSGTNAALLLGSGTTGPVVLGSGPSIATAAVNDAAIAGGVASATLRGTLTSLNGLPQADVWFVWGYASTLLTNTTATATTAALGAKTAVITGFDSRYTIFYEFRSATDGTSLGGVQSFNTAHIVGFTVLQNVLTLIIAAGILLVALRLSDGNWGIFLTLCATGFVGIALVRALLA